MLTGLLYAMKGEIESLLPEGAEPEKTVAGVPFYRIRENVVACCGGVGKVNAAMATQLFIDLYAPGRIVNVGVAGCFENVPIGTLVLADRFMQHDVDTSGIGDPVGLVSTVNRIDFPTAELEKAKDAMDGPGTPTGWAAWPPASGSPRSVTGRGGSPRRSTPCSLKWRAARRHRCVTATRCRSWR